MQGILVLYVKLGGIKVIFVNRPTLLVHSCLRGWCRLQWSGDLLSSRAERSSIRPLDYIVLFAHDLQQSQRIKYHRRKVAKLSQLRIILHDLYSILQVPFGILLGNSILSLTTIFHVCLNAAAKSSN